MPAPSEISDIARQDTMKKIFDFLNENSKFNQQTQHIYYGRALAFCPTNFSKIESLLHGVAQTQAYASLDALQHTWKRLQCHKRSFDEIRTVKQLADALKLLESQSDKKTPNAPPVFDSMWTSLTKTDGFGKKTAALFVKSVIDIHTLDVNVNIRFLEQFKIDPADRIRVPVDSAISYIFEKIDGYSKGFDRVNKLISDFGVRSDSHPTIWDDLWFWGFITQKTVEGKRELQMNLAKLWSLIGSPKEDFPEIEKAARKFMEILENTGR